jgi:FkbM family methyltransferase
MTIQKLLIKAHNTGLLPQLAERYLRQRTWRIAAGEGSGLKVCFPQNLEYLLGTSERPIQRVLSAHLRAGDVFYDVGANVGFFTLIAARRLGPAGAVYAFEPVSENAATISRNVRLNGFTNTVVLQAAVDANSGVGEMLLTGWDGGASLAQAANPPAMPTDRRTVRVFAIDDAIKAERFRPPTLIKIDVEGAEAGAIVGMEATLRRHKPVLVYEIDDGDRDSFHARWESLDQIVTEHGYRVTRLEQSYPDMKWHVGHSLAVPADAKGTGW